jgi:site-specific DNA-cytosine methylase
MTKKPIVVLSLFDGFSGGQQALERAGIPVDTYYASEIDKAAIAVTQHRFPKTIQVGDVTKLRVEYLKPIDLVIAGSPCQSISAAGRLLGIATTAGEIIDTLEKYKRLKDFGAGMTQSALFWEFVRVLEDVRYYNPNVQFLLENVVNKHWGEMITRTLGVLPHTINSSFFSAQNRNRSYWTNISFTVRDGRDIKLNEVIPSAVAGAGIRGVPIKEWMDNPKGKKYRGKLTIRKDFKSNCVTCNPSTLGMYLTTSGEIKNITPEHAEALQTVKIGFTDVPGITKTQRFHMIGNGWTIDVIKNFFENL